MLPKSRRKSGNSSHPAHLKSVGRWNIIKNHASVRNESDASEFLCKRLSCSRISLWHTYFVCFMVLLKKYHPRSIQYYIWTWQSTYDSQNPRPKFFKLLSFQCKISPFHLCNLSDILLLLNGWHSFGYTYIYTHIHIFFNVYIHKQIFIQLLKM